MKSLLDYLAAWCVAFGGGAFVGGVMFNTIGMRRDLESAGIGGIVVLVFLFLGCFFKLKGGK